MKHLKLTIEKAQEAFKNGSDDRKQFLIDLYGQEHFLTSINDRLKGYSSACKILGRKELTLNDFSFLGESQSKRQFARHKIVTGIEAINEGWFPNFEDENEYKYYNWLYNKNNAFDFCCDDYFDVCSAGSDLCLKTREKAEIIQKVFKEDYITYIFGY